MTSSSNLGQRSNRPSKPRSNRNKVRRSPYSAHSTVPPTTFPSPSSTTIDGLSYSDENAYYNGYANFSGLPEAGMNFPYPAQCVELDGKPAYPGLASCQMAYPLNYSAGQYLPRSACNIDESDYHTYPPPHHNPQSKLPPYEYPDPLLVSKTSCRSNSIKDHPSGIDGSGPEVVFTPDCAYDYRSLTTRSDSGIHSSASPSPPSILFNNGENLQPREPPTPARCEPPTTGRADTSRGCQSSRPTPSGGAKDGPTQAADDDACEATLPKQRRFNGSCAAAVDVEPVPAVPSSEHSYIYSCLRNNQAAWSELNKMSDQQQHQQGQQQGQQQGHQQGQQQHQQQQHQLQYSSVIVRKRRSTSDEFVDRRSQDGAAWNYFNNGCSENPALYANTSTKLGNGMTSSSEIPSDLPPTSKSSFNIPHQFYQQHSNHQLPSCIYTAMEDQIATRGKMRSPRGGRQAVGTAYSSPLTVDPATSADAVRTPTAAGSAVRTPTVTAGTAGYTSVIVDNQVVVNGFVH